MDDTNSAGHTQTPREITSIDLDRIYETLDKFGRSVLADKYVTPFARQAAAVAIANIMRRAFDEDALARIQATLDLSAAEAADRLAFERRSWPPADFATASSQSV